MTCHHSAGDTSCSSHPDNIRQRQYEYEEEQRQKTEREREKKAAEVYAKTPDKAKFEIVEFQRLSNHVVLKVRYPNCTKCSYEGNKVMVFLNVTEAQMIRWREIDPHFRDPKNQPAQNEAPSPAARFPASDQGWRDAVEYARLKCQ